MQLTDQIALEASRKIMALVYGPMPAGGSVQLQAQIQELIIDALAKPADKQCKCDLRTSLVGDGCEVCNPTMAAALSAEQPNNGKENAVQQAQQWAQEARTQRAIVRSILRILDLPENDWEAGSLVKAKFDALRSAEQPAIQPKAQIPSEWLQPGAIVPVTFETVQTLLNAVRALSGAQAQTEQDAARYRWIRQYFVDVSNIELRGVKVWPEGKAYTRLGGRGTQLDAAIDAAMVRQQSEWK